MNSINSSSVLEANTLTDAASYIDRNKRKVYFLHDDRGAHLQGSND